MEDVGVDPAARDGAPVLAGLDPARILAIAEGEVLARDLINTPSNDMGPEALEAAELAGLRTGIVATSSVAHATPAGFAAHAENRYAYEIIMEQLVHQDLDVVLGGGRKYLLPEGAVRQALAQYDELCRLLKQELDAEPSPKTQALAEASFNVGYFYQKTRKAWRAAIGRYCRSKVCSASAIRC